MRSKPPAPVPPTEPPPARTLIVPGRGEFFFRDSGLLSAAHASRPTLLLLHGWTATADLNWGAQYADLIGAGYRVIAIDHRGHGRGLRTFERFKLSDCAADAAAVVRTLKLGTVTVVGYSMGGAVAQLLARDHSDVVSGLVLSGTAQRFAYEGNRRQLQALPLLRGPLATAPKSTWKMVLGQMGLTSGSDGAWLMGEMLRHDPHAIIEAGRELARFDSRPWLRPFSFPTAFVLTTVDDAVPPALQRELIAATGAEVFEAPIRHMQITSRPADYNPALLRALEYIAGATGTEGSAAA
jgi:3-oxoadipate enol-lactonase